MKERVSLPARLTRGKPAGELKYELAAAEDAAACNAVNNGLLKRNRTLQQWTWEFLPKHLPFEELPYAVARDGSDIVGTQGAIILPMLSKAGPFWSGKGEDTIVLPRYWDRNALVSMYALIFDLFRRKSISLSWGFNASKASFSKVGITYFDEPLCADQFCVLDRHGMEAVLADTKSMKKRFERRGGQALKAGISAGAAAWTLGRNVTSQVLRGFSRPKGLTIEELSGHPGEEFEHLARRFIAHYGGVTLHRSPAFLKWRLLENPFLRSRLLVARIHGELCGYAALSDVKDGVAYISDQLICAPDASLNCGIAEELIAAVISRARSTGTSVLRTQSFNAHPADLLLRSGLKRTGFLARTKSVGPCYFLLPEGGMLPERITEYKTWYVTSVYTEGRQG